MGGGDKGLLEVGGRSLLMRVIDRLAPQAGPLMLNANGDPARFSDFGLELRADSVAEFPGPLAGVLAGLDWAAELGAERIVTVAADTPFFPEDLVTRLTSAGTGLALAVTPHAARGQVRHPTFGVWPTALREDLRSALDEGLRKVVLWTDRHGAEDVLFPSEDAFFNVNTPEDLAHAEALI